MSFKFRFASILELRRRQRDEAGAAVGKANQAISRIDEQIDAIRLQREDVRSSSTRSRVGEISVENLLAVGRYEMQLDGDISRLRTTLGELINEMNRRQQLLMDAEAEVKRFERLESNERETHRTEMLAREQADADERSTQAYILARRGSKT